MIRVVFAGTPVFAVPFLEALIKDPSIEVVGVISQPDRPRGRGRQLAPSPVKALALKAGIDVQTPERLKGNQDALAWLSAKDADILVVVAYGMILPPSWLAATPHGAINVHASLLPRWRGAAPIERAILAGDEVTGVTIMQMDEGLDTGCYYAQASLAIGEDTTGGQLAFMLSHVGATLLLQTLPWIVKGAIPCRPQDDRRATYAAKIQNAERNIDWRRDAVWIHRVIRAFSPSPGARARLDGTWLKILRAEIVEEMTLPPGKIHVEGGVLVGSGTSCLRLDIVQPEGKRAMDAQAWVRGLRCIPERFEVETKA